MAGNRDDPNADAERELLLTEIITDDLKFRVRERLSEDRIEYFAEILDELPPVEVFDVRGKLYLVDGFHRHAAARRPAVRAFELPFEEGRAKTRSNGL